MSDNQRVQINYKKKLLLVGTQGYGKSSTGNKLLDDNIFSSGEIRGGVTKILQYGESDQYEITDCPGFGDLTERDLFLNQIINHKNDLRNRSPFNALILVIKFKADNNGGISSDGFLGSAKDFFDAFGNNGLESLMLLCIQTDLRLGNAAFDAQLKSSGGYEYLTIKKNEASLPNANDIPYVLWDNKDPYPRQQQRFTDCLNAIPEFTKESMSSAFQFVERKLETLNAQPKPQPVRRKKCIIS